MAFRYEVEVTISSAKDIKNVNWRYGPTRPYAVVWIDPNVKCSTRSDNSGDTNPRWDQTLLLPLPPPLPLDDATLHIDLVHAGAEEDTNRLIGAARLRLKDLVDEIGLGERISRSVHLKRPSGRPHGKIEVTVSVREAGYRPPDPYAAPPYGVPPPATGAREIYGGPPPPQPYGYPYGGPSPPNPYYASQPSGYPYGSGAVAAAAAPPPYGQPTAYGPPGGYGYEEEKKKKSGMGMGAGLALGVAGGALGAVALAEGAEYVEDAINDAAEDAVDDALGF